jgi:hypothetical protein
LTYQQSADARAQAKRESRVTGFGEHREHLADDPHKVAGRVRVPEEELWIAVDLGRARVVRDHVAEIGGEDRVLEVSGQDVRPRFARGENAHQKFLFVSDGSWR